LVLDLTCDFLLW